jgi:hypothetical protein
MTIRKAELEEKSVLSRLHHPQIVYSRTFFENRLLFAVGMKRELKRALQPDGNDTVIHRKPGPCSRRHPFERETTQQPVQQVTVAAKTKTPR